MITIAILALSLHIRPDSGVKRVWQAAIKSGFSGGAIVVSGKKTLLFEIKNASSDPVLQIRKNKGFPLCSVTKAMTSELILGLIHEDKVSLDGKAREYLPWLPEFTSEITVRQLLTHTSGLANMDNALGTNSDNIGNIYFTYDEDLRELRPRILKIIGSALAAKAGTKYDYNNSDFLVLQAISEAVTHQTFDQVLRTRIFAAAKLKSTTLAMWDPTAVPFTQCFQTLQGKDIPLKPFNMAIYGGAAGVISTPDDLSRWLKFTLTNPSGQSLLESGSQYGGFQGFGGYAYKTAAVSKALSSDTPEVAYERPGAVNAYGLQVSFLPGRHLAVAVFSNRDGEQLGSIYEGKGLAFELIVAASREVSAPNR